MGKARSSLFSVTILSLRRMTVIEKLSDRHGFIFPCIKMILLNKGMMQLPKLQWELFQCGIFVTDTLLKQAIAVMYEKGEILKPKPKDEVVPEVPAASVQ